MNPIDYSVYCQPDNVSACEIGDLSGKHGLLNISGSPSDDVFFYTDTYLDLTGENSVTGHSIVINQNDELGEILACAPLVARDEIQVEDIFGEFTARSDSQFTETTATTSIDISRLTLLSSVTAPNQLCHVVLSSSNVPVYNPYNVLPPEKKTVTPDQLPVGDISGKNITGSGILPEFPIYGLNTVALRSLGYTSGSGEATTEICSALLPSFAGTTIQLKARASFKGILSGAIYFVC